MCLTLSAGEGTTVGHGMSCGMLLGSFLLWSLPARCWCQQQNCSNSICRSALALPTCFEWQADRVLAWEMRMLVAPACVGSLQALPYTVLRLLLFACRSVAGKALVTLLKVGAEGETTAIVASEQVSFHSIPVSLPWHLAQQPCHLAFGGAAQRCAHGRPEAPAHRLSL